MEFNATHCNAIAKHVYNEKMKEKYFQIIDTILKEAEKGHFSAIVEEMNEECCEWLLRLKFKISLLQPTKLSEKIGWHWISETYYKEELQKYGHNGVKIEWK